MPRRLMKPFSSPICLCNAEALKSAMRNQELAAAADHLNSFAADLVTLLAGESQADPA
jgi:hypothetical protein